MITNYSIPPHPLLQPFVDNYLFSTSHGKTITLTNTWAASNETSLVFYLADQPYHYANHLMPSPLQYNKGCVVGLQAKYNGTVSFRGMYCTFLVQFKANGFHKLFHIPAGDLVNKMYQLDDVFGNAAREVSEKLQQAKDIQQMARVADEFLLFFLHSRKKNIGLPDGITLIAGKLFTSSTPPIMHGTKTDIMNTIPDNWYETFFAGINCEMWSKATTEEWTSAEVAFIKEVLDLSAGSEILDMPCGTGRHSVSLARQGFRLTAIDISDEYIRGLRKVVAAEHLPVKVIQGDMMAIQLNSMYDGAFCFGNSFGYFTHSNMQSFIQNVSAALRPGARWIINSGLMAESFLAKFSKEKTYGLPGFTMHISNDYDEWNSCLLSTLTYTKDGKEEVHRFKHHIYTVAEVIRWLSAFDLQTTALYNTTSKETYRLGDAQVYLVAEKR